MEYVEPGVGIANCLGRPVCKYLKYHRKLNDYVRNFGRIRDELNCKMKDIELQLKAELLSPSGKIPKQGVENWLKDVKEMIAEAQDVENKVSNRRYLCRAWNGKLVDEKTREMKEFLDKAPNASEALAMDGPSGGLPLPTSELEVKKIGVWGMGGVGKTTIMKHIHNDHLKEQRFERVIWVTTSKEFNVMKVQDDIASALKLKEDLAIEGDKLRRAAILSEMLKKVGKHVLILDDVWDEVSLEEVGILEPSDSNGCKLVLTTRSENVFGPNTVQNQTLMPILRLVVEECAGLPVTIVVVAGTLKGEEDPLIWKNALRELKERIEKVEGVEAKVIERLKFSFDHLKDEKVRYCFLHCALYPEDFEILKNELINTRQEMKDKGHVILKKLEDNCSLENVTTPFSNMNPRYMVQAGLQLEKLPKEEQWSPDIEKVSLMCNSITEFPVDVLPTKCQLLTTLLLQRNPIKKIPNPFFANMPCLSFLNFSFTKIESLPNSISELKNLTTLLLCGCHELRDLPCLSMLQELKKLDLYGTKIEEVPEGMDMLIKLSYLNLEVSTLKEIPAGLLPKLVHLQHLCLEVENEKISLKAEEMEPLNEFNKFISSMQQSKKNLIKYNLLVGSYNMGWGRDKLVTIDWEGELIMHPIEMQELNIIDCDYLRSLVDDKSPFKNAIDLRNWSATTLQLAPSATFFHLKQIGVYRCSSMKTLLPRWLLPNLQNLEEIWVQECDELVEILGAATSEVEEKGSDALIKFHLPNLRELGLRELPNLKSICSKSGVMVCDSVQLIHISRCDKLNRIPPFVPLVGNGQPFAYAPPSLTIRSTTEWWESLE
ncbi:hypothetical protein ES332_A04G046200v1 [Gossypium tomentosum]|uniref:NB-ARC domain-containing protein n=1 Tax=Gossypium tomentosum TaxID=34277 RepID=A0A5D2QUX7_GOSTO|nr:hypothetical protein ES332_A04G046200v1 [Gossypium tomentosum]